MDEYYIDYVYVRETPIASAIFNHLPSALTCKNMSDDAGPTRSRNPLDDVSRSPIAFNTALPNHLPPLCGLKDSYALSTRINEETTSISNLSTASQQDIWKFQGTLTSVDAFSS